MLQSGNEVSPGTLQHSNGSVGLRAEWMAISKGATYDGERCAAVIPMVDPEGYVLKTDRQSTCTGATSFGLNARENGTGEFTVKASIAPWDKPDDAVVSEKTFTLVAAGS